MFIISFTPKLQPIMRAIAYTDDTIFLTCLKADGVISPRPVKTW